MSDRLEKFIQTNRSGFDSDMYAHGWEKLDARLQPRHNRRTIFRKRYIATAAAAVVLITAGLTLSDWQEQQGRAAVSPNVTGLLPQEVIADIDPVFARQVYRFATLIDERQKELHRAGTQYPQLYREFGREVYKLDSTYRSLRSELVDYPNQEMLLAALIGNLQLQLSLLNRQLEIINQLKNKKHESKII